MEEAFEGVPQSGRKVGRRVRVGGLGMWERFGSIDMGLALNTVKQQLLSSTVLVQNRTESGSRHKNSISH